MSDSRLIELSYFAPNAKTRLTAYADTIMMDRDGKDSVITAIRFGGYPEMVRAMSDAIYGGGTIEAVRNSEKRTLKSVPKRYRRQLPHDGVYATAPLMANDDLTADSQGGEEDDKGKEGIQQEIQPRKCYLFCPAGDRDRLFEELDHKTAAPLIPEFRDYVLGLKPEDANVVEILEDGLKSGEVSVPGADPDGVENVTGYLNTFGATVAQRIRSQFQPLFDPATEPLSGSKWPDTADFGLTRPIKSPSATSLICSVRFAQVEPSRRGRLHPFRWVGFGKTSDTVRSGQSGDWISGEKQRREPLSITQEGNHERSRN